MEFSLSEYAFVMDLEDESVCLEQDEALATFETDIRLQELLDEHSQAFNLSDKDADRLSCAETPTSSNILHVKKPSSHSDSIKALDPVYANAKDNMKLCAHQFFAVEGFEANPGLPFLINKTRAGATPYQ
mmetsp:Transcript_7058/g.21936  ORF Transcript_7058/g.21936 Transcript_7058/m.21936 type:complete len:130 (-) Transcript_7058:70-459(-)